MELRKLQACSLQCPVNGSSLPIFLFGHSQNLVFSLLEFWPDCVSSKDSSHGRRLLPACGHLWWVWHAFPYCPGVCFSTREIWVWLCLPSLHRLCALLLHGFFFVLLAFSFMRTKRTCSFWDLFEIPGQNTEELGREDLTMNFSDVAVGWEPSLYYLQPFCPGFHISLHHFFPICLTENLRTKGFTQYLQTIKNCMLGQLPRILLLYTGSRPVILHETSQRFLYFIPIRHKTRFT